MWCPGGAGDSVKYVGGFGTGHWFQTYNDADTDVRTTAKFEYGSFNLQAQDGVGYVGSDKHYFTGDAIFFNRITYDGPTVNDTDVASKKYVDDRIAELEARITALGG